MLYLVTYDLKPNADYNRLYTLIKEKYPASKDGVHEGAVQNVWFVPTNDLSEDIVNKIGPASDDKGTLLIRKLFVVEVAGNAASMGFSQADEQWIENNIS
jgi:hypothetical protein